MKTITNNNYNLLLEEFLEEKDTVIFIYKNHAYEYIVYDCYIGAVNNTEDIIFKVLVKDDLINQSFNDFLSDCYGYPCLDRPKESNMWRDYHKNDWKAITNTVLRIFNIISGTEKPIVSIPLKSLTDISFLK